MRLYKRKGSPNWWATWNDQNGQRRRKSTGTDDKDLAQAIAAKWKQDSFMEHHFGSIPDVPFREALVRYGKERKRENPQGYEDNVRYRLQRLLDTFDDLNVADITLARIQDYTDERLQSVKNGTALKELATLKAILNKAFREGHLARLPSFPKVKQVKGRTRWLTPEEEAKLLKFASPHLKHLIRFALDTGGRRSELLNLDWRNVDLERGFVTFIKTKNGEDHAIRLTERAVKVLRDIGPKESGPVFTYHGKAIRSVKTSFDAARDKAGLEDFRFHDLRHTFASRLVQQGVSLYEVMHLTGHKSFQMVQRYAHLSPEFQARAISALESYGTAEGLPQNTMPVKRHDLGTADSDGSGVITPKSLKEMVGTAGIEPATPAV